MTRIFIYGLVLAALIGEALMFYTSPKMTDKEASKFSKLIHGAQQRGAFCWAL